MKIRTFQAGDEAGQAAVYNAVAHGLPRFKPATLGEVERRVKARDFDAGQRFYAEKDGEVVGYATFSANGRVSYPWCLPGHEDAAEPLFTLVLEEMKRRGMKLAFAAYRGDWPEVGQFFVGHGFQHARDMVNFVIDRGELPTAPRQASGNIRPIQATDLPALLDLAGGALRVQSVAELEECLLRNPYFGPESLFVLQGRGNAGVVAAGIFIRNPAYADPKVLDSNMPCFRLGAFGTETMQAKRVRGLFSFLAKPGPNLLAIGLDLLNYALLQVQPQDQIETIAAQAPSDVPHLLDFYQRYEHRQGAFPVWERPLTAN